MLVKLDTCARRLSLPLREVFVLLAKLQMRNRRAAGWYSCDATKRLTSNGTVWNKAFLRQPTLFELALDQSGKG